MNDLLILLLLMHSNCSYIFAINNFPLHIFYILKSDQFGTTYLILLICSRLTITPVLCFYVLELYVYGSFK